MWCYVRTAVFTVMATAMLACSGVDESAKIIPVSVKLVAPIAITTPIKHRLSRPDQQMPMMEQVDFAVGRSFFRNPWVEAPSATSARDGLGPLFNAISCASCHVSSARGIAAVDGQPLLHYVVRLSVPGENGAGKAGFIPEPSYGGQLQNQAIGDVLPEGRAIIHYSEKIQRLAHDEQVVLQKPNLTLDRLAYGEMLTDVRSSVRLAPVLTGLGLLEAVPEQQLLEWVDEDDSNDDGISGRANLVWDIESQQHKIGRFGWKAEQPSVRQQTAGAFHADLGISSELIQRENCTTIEVTCQQTEHGGTPEITDKLLDHVTFYVANLAAPGSGVQQDDDANTGQALFEQAGCQKCHRPRLHAGESKYPWLSNRTIYPYTDLLLHDLGDELADNRAVFGASGREWRTAPLWGIGMAKKIAPGVGFLHDGRARNVLEAILWHGGEAQQSRVIVEQMTSDERSELLRFVESL